MCRHGSHLYFIHCSGKRWCGWGRCIGTGHHSILQIDQGGGGAAGEDVSARVTSLFIYFSGRMRCGWRRCIGTGHLSIYIFFREDAVRLEKMYRHGSPIYCINCSGRLVRLEGVARWLYLTEIVSAGVTSLFMNCSGRRWCGWRAT